MGSCLGLYNIALSGSQGNIIMPYSVTFVECLETLSAVVTPYLQLPIQTPSHYPVS